MPKSFKLDGKRRQLPAAVPSQQIEWIVARMHVSDTDAEVRNAIADRAAENPKWTKRLIEAAQDYAVYCHRKNRALYTFVTTGSR